MAWQKEIIICAKTSIEINQIYKYLSIKESKEMLSNTFPFKIDIIPAIPTFSSDEEIQKLKEEGVFVPDLRDVPYTIYLHNGIKKPLERLVGVELPTSVLRHYELFKPSVLGRIKAVVGYPSYN